MAKDNARWGYARIQGELRRLGHEVAPSTIAATDLFTAEVLTPRTSEPSKDGDVVVDERLGWPLRSYRRSA